MQLVGLNQYEPEYSKLMININDIQFNQDEVVLNGDYPQYIISKKENVLELSDEFKGLSLIDDFLNKNGNKYQSLSSLKGELLPLIINQIQKAISHFCKVYNENEGKAYLMTIGEYKEKQYQNFFFDIYYVIQSNIEAFQSLKQLDFNFEPLYEELTIDRDIIPLENEELLVRDFL